MGELVAAQCSARARPSWASYSQPHSSPHARASSCLLGAESELRLRDLSCRCRNGDGRRDQVLPVHIQKVRSHRDNSHGQAEPGRLLDYFWQHPNLLALADGAESRLAGEITSLQLTGGYPAPPTPDLGRHAAGKEPRPVLPTGGTVK